jgi:hypothetical protein
MECAACKSVIPDGSKFSIECGARACCVPTQIRRALNSARIAVNSDGVLVYFGYPQAHEDVQSGPFGPA